MEACRERCYPEEGRVVGFWTSLLLELLADEQWAGQAVLVEVDLFTAD